MADTNGNPKSNMATPEPPKSGSGGPIIKASQEPDEYQQAIHIILVTVVSVIGIVGIIALILLLWRYVRNRREERHRRHHRSPSLQSISVEVSNKQLPVVLLLYSYDCPMHEKVVQALGGFLMEACSCNVTLDLFEEQIIHDQGLDDWLVERLQDADFIIVVCSVGARLRCSKKRIKFKVDALRTLPDYFAVAVDYVAEKMRAERTKGLSMSKFVTLYMDYSTASDIPPQLETGTKFCLMKDIGKLYSHLHCPESEDRKATFPLMTESTYQDTEIGAELYVAIEQAKDYFSRHPNWVEDRLEPVSAAASGKNKKRHKRKTSLEQPLLPSSCGEDKIKMLTNCLDTTVEVHTLPRVINMDETPMNSFLYSRQNSLPSSLSSHVTPHVSTNHISISKSFDSFYHNGRSGGGDCDELPPCIVCGKYVHTDGKVSCRKQTEPPEIEVDSIEYIPPKNKSKSMPVVYGTDFTSGSPHTVLHAEVHNEWESDGRTSRLSDSQDSVSLSGSDTLERDLRSIKVLPTFDHVHYSASAYMLSELSPLRSLSSSAIVSSLSDYRIRVVPTLVPVSQRVMMEPDGNFMAQEGQVVSL
ncbi:uncharacterized protein LOC121368080 [Gigantopelta aegis]|uniref:uncharacterized protein LOC121368080 n=1 Tax=Gigantopelta aegis TaxID=1735272 RepID=UPI001B88B440|nr:uncharacterized protein LOC121368080 [Gigantopelta aegis]